MTSWFKFFSQLEKMVFESNKTAMIQEMGMQIHFHY